MTDEPTGNLLPSQIRTLEQTVARSALGREPFEWRLIDGRWAGYLTPTELPAIVHVESGYFFSLEYAEAFGDGLGNYVPEGFHFARGPGIQSPTDVGHSLTWEDILREFGLWLRLVGRELGRAGTVAPTSANRGDQPHGEIWPFLHTEIVQIAKARFDAGHYADAVEASLKHINELLQRKAREMGAGELDGSALMKRVFSVNAPLLRLGDLATDTGRSMQIGYMELFSGAMTGIRNPKAHANVEIDAVRAIHFLVLASLLRHKLDEATT